MMSSLQHRVPLSLSPPSSPPSPHPHPVGSTKPGKTMPAVVKPLPKLASTSKAQMRKKGKRGSASVKKNQDGLGFSTSDKAFLDINGNGNGNGSCCDEDHLTSTLNSNSASSSLSSYPERPPTPPHASCSSKCSKFDYTRISLTRENWVHVSALLWALISVDMRGVMEKQSSGAFVSQISTEGRGNELDLDAEVEVDPNSSISHALRHRYLNIAPPSAMPMRKGGRGSGMDLGFTTTHAGCQLRACAVKRASMFDKLLEAEYRSVPIMLHVQPELIGKAPLRPFNLDLHMHVHTDDITGSEYICAPEFVRVFFPCFYSSVTKLMHSLYTLNHAYGRGSICPIDEYGYDDPQAVLPLDTWKHWVGCPQALQSRKPCPDEMATRIWLVNGAAEVAFGAECEPDQSTIDPEITTGPDVVRSKGKGRA